ncbi:MAG: hypothetical protein U9Q82_09980 [Chloroflexota bacterium]|nr:hypothetical protein [Chloroflexota bacterium]
MLKRIIRVLGGDPNKKKIQEFTETVDLINELETQFETLSDEALHAKTREFRIRLVRGETLDDILPETFAAVREVSKKTIGQRHYDVQLICGIAMHRGIVSEMKTGEGKTLAATLPLYLNALDLNPRWVEMARSRWGADPEGWDFSPINATPIGRGAHLVTVNDYLARRDARWMGPIYDSLGLSVGVLQMAARTEHGKKAFIVDLEKTSPHEDQNQIRMVTRREAYNADITYGTNNEFGFDYLRDNMKMTLGERVQREHHFAIIDEVDNVLIDEARTPLIISGPSHEDSANYVRMASVVKKLKPQDYEISLRDRNISLTPIGETHVEQILGQALRDPDRPEDITPHQAQLLGYLQQALNAEYIYKRNKDYVVQRRKIIIVDHFTGRLMPGRRWSNGLHQAVEAKEGVPIQSETVTYATITIQNYFRMYTKLAGMTGTAVTEAEEFNEIYGLDALAIPTNLDYEASQEDTPLITLQDRDQQNYKYTYYANKNDPQREAIFWKRKDYPDVIYRTEEAKLRSIVQEILTYHVIGRPILVGTTSVELSERVSGRLDSHKVRTLAQTLLVRDVWLETNDAVEDGRQIAQLVPLNTPLDKLRSSDLRKMIRDENLNLPLTPLDDSNLERMLRILGLSSSNKERLANVLRGGISHQVLNARKHTEESQIIAGAGAFGAVTIATNMAGRGVDIKLGGELAENILVVVNRVLTHNGYDDSYDMSMEELRDALQTLTEDAYGIYKAEIEYFLSHLEEKERVRELGGLHVIGSERHEARRIDNQLRGRAARQGDPGSSSFYLSLEDDLMVRFGGQQMESLLARMNVDEAMPIANQLVSSIVEHSQTRVEGANFDVRKHLLEYDDVLNTQREKIYAQRDRILTKDDLTDDVTDMLREEVLHRVPESLADDEGPWKLLSWLNQIQPPLPLREKIFPSYTVKLMLDNIGKNSTIADLPSRNSNGLQNNIRISLAPTEASAALLGLAKQSIQAEETHLVNKVDQLLESSKANIEMQIDERIETLDTYIEGLALSAEPNTSSAQKLSRELSELLRLPLQLSSEVAGHLRDDPYSVIDGLRKLVREVMQSLMITRLIGAVERVLKTSLELPHEDLIGKDWDELANRIMAAIQDIFTERLEHYIGDNESPGKIARDLNANIAKLDKQTLSEQDVLSLIMIMPQGRRQAFDKKTHRRVWKRTRRLTFIYMAARAIDNRTPEDITNDVLAHLEDAQAAIRAAWGQSELARLNETQLNELAQNTCAGLKKAIGENVFSNHQDQRISSLGDKIQEQVADELGRQALTKIYRQLLLRVISSLWIDYLTQMEALRVAIGLEAYAQRDPLVQYKTKAFEMFKVLLQDMRMGVATKIFTFRPSDVSSVQAAIREADIPSPHAPRKRRR